MIKEGKDNISLCEGHFAWHGMACNSDGLLLLLYWESWLGTLNDGSQERLPHQSI
jgi:hypothetical protein